MTTRTAKQAAAGYLSRREYSRHELHQKLARQYAADDIERALADLQNEGLLCDVRFVETFMRGAAARFGRAKLHQQLTAHRICPRRIDEALQNLPADAERAADLLQQKYKNNFLPQHKQQAWRFLLSRGFAMDDAQKAIDNLWGDLSADAEW